jgi:DNA ligase-4
MRLILPHLDKERQTYGMKETNLGKCLVEILGISPTSEDATRMIHWKIPTLQVETPVGDFSTCVYMSLKNRCLTNSQLTVNILNGFLDELNVASDRKDKLLILKKIVRSSTALEMKWIVRILLKDLKIGLSEKSILGLFHREALDMYNVTSNLRTVCEELVRTKGHTKGYTKGYTKGHTKVSESLPLSIEIGRALKPMLASRHSPEEVVKLMEGSPFVIEKKYDGERVMIHKNGKEIQLFSRNCNEITNLYGELLAPLILQCVAASRCILDGELLVYDTLTEQFEEFGKLKTFAKEAAKEAVKEAAKEAAKEASNEASQATQTQDKCEKDEISNIGKQLCYVAFDLLYVNDRSVADLNLAQRVQLLRRCVKPRSKQFEVIEQKEAKTTNDIIDALDEAIMSREEGIVIKNLSTPYIPNERKASWIKIKPDYLEGLGDDLDLLIIGGYYGKGGRKGSRGAGKITHFMLGVPSCSSSCSSSCSNTTNPKDVIYYSFCRVGTGYSGKELEELQKLLEPHWKNFDAQHPPSCIDLGDSLKDKPDVWIHPRHSKILQVKAAQITPTKKYKTGFTLRFPRVERIRLDKEWNEGLNFEELNQLVETFGGRFTKRKYGETQQEGSENGTETGKKKKKKSVQRKQRVVSSFYQPSDLSSVEITTQLFDQLEFCIMNGDDDIFTKAQMEAWVHRNGGKMVQNPTMDTHYIIASKKTLKVQNLITEGKWNVIYGKWLKDCIDFQTVLPLEPKYMMFTSPNTQQKFLIEMDKFGDAYSKNISSEDLLEIFQRMNSSIPKPDLRDQISDIESHCFGGKTKWGFFRNFVFYFDRFEKFNDETTAISSSLELIEEKARFYGANIVSQMTSNVTHIIMDSSELTRWKEIRKEIHRWVSKTKKPIHIVNQDWIEESIMFREDLDEFSFLVNQNK